MKKVVMVVHDAKAELYGTPMFFRTVAEGIRSFQQLVDDPETMIGKYPEDYHLYKLGEYDEDTGLIYPGDAPLHLGHALHMKNPETSPLDSPQLMEA